MGSADQSELPNEIVLREPRDFEWAIDKLCGRVVAHDVAVECCLRCLGNRVALRSASTDDVSAPLAALLLCGPAGIGKRHLARSIGELLFREGRFTTFDFAVESVQSVVYRALFGDSLSDVKLW